VAKNAFDAYLIVSDVVASVTISGAPVDAKSSPTFAAAAACRSENQASKGLLPSAGR